MLSSTEKGCKKTARPDKLYRIHYEQRTGKPRGLCRKHDGAPHIYEQPKKQATTEELMDEVGHSKATTHKSYIFGDQQQIEQRSTLGVARMRRDDLRRSA